MTPPNLPDGEPHPASQANALDGAAAEGVIAAVGEHWCAAPVFGTEVEGDEPIVVPRRTGALLWIMGCHEAHMIALCRFHHLAGEAEDPLLKVRVPVQGRGGLERGVKHIHPSKVMDSLRGC